MRLLLDTHTAVWAVMDDANLSMSARRLLEDPQNTVFVSVVSLWEIAIKSSLGGRRSGAMPISAAAALQEFAEAGFDILPISARHAVAVETLPSLHGDPFDRLLIAQAIEEPMRLVTHDAIVESYSDTIIRF